jgi:hypothetical protein
MIVTLDGQRLNDSFPTNATLQALLNQVRAAHLDGRLIVTVAIDGRPLRNDDLNACLAEPVMGQQVDLESGEPSVLAAAALDGLAAEFAEAGPRLAQIAERLNSADMPAAIREVGDFMALWQTCYRALPQCGTMLGCNLLEQSYDGQPVRTYLNDVVDKLTQVRAALEARDVVMLADLLRYELPALVQTWQGITAHLAEQVHVAAELT